MKRNRKKGKVIQRRTTVPTHSKRAKIPAHRNRATTSKVVKSTRTAPRNKVKQQVKTKMKIVLIAMILVIGALSLGLKDVKSKPTRQIEKNCKVETRDYNNREVFTVTPTDGAKNKRVIFYLHGGAYMAEMTKEHWEFIDKIVNDTGSTVIIADYPLAPKYDCNKVFEMVEPLYKEIVEQAKSQNLILMGDSAGGGLALSLLEKLKSSSEEPSKVVLISPWLDVSMSNEKMNEIQKNDKELNIHTLKIAGKAYANKVDVKDFLVSPIYGDVSKLKNVTILTGTNDILNPDVYELEQRMKEKGKSLKIKSYEGATHNWIIQHNCDEELVERGYNDLKDLID